MPLNYTEAAPTRDELNARAEPLLVQFGANWCGHCQGAQALIDEALTKHPELKPVMVEDGRGRPLGRNFQVKLWPTLVFLKGGQEVARVVRPGTVGEIEDAIATLLGV
jgi:thioredoxin 1